MHTRRKAVWLASDNNLDIVTEIKSLEEQVGDWRAVSAYLCFKYPKVYGKPSRKDLKLLRKYGLLE